MKTFKKVLLWIGAILLLIALGQWGYALLVAVAGLLLWRWVRRPRLPEPGEGDFGPVPEALKDAVWQRQQGKCAVKKCYWANNLNIHHITHREQGGDNRLSNLVYLCPNHHAEAHRPGQTWRGPVPMAHFDED